MTRQPDVVVVGGGPAGAATAGLLARAGAAVLLLDAARFPRPKPCGECLNPGAVAALRRLGLWEAAEPLAPAPIVGWRLHHAGRRPLDLTFPGGAAGVAVDRHRLDHALLAWAARQGARVEEGVRVTDLLPDAHGRVAGVCAGGRRIPARFVVGADGLRSVVVRRLGLLAPRRPGTAAAHGKVAFTAHWSGIGGLTDRGELHFRAPAVVGIAPVGGGQANVTLVLPAALARRGRRPESVFPHMKLAERFAHARPTGRPLATGPFDQPVRAVAAPGALLVGDAAGYFDPLTGQGIYRALRSAELAAPTLLAALSGDHTAFHRYHEQLTTEFTTATRHQRWIDSVVKRPALLSAGLGLLRLMPPAGRWLIGLVGDCYHDHGGSE